MLCNHAQGPLKQKGSPIISGACHQLNSVLNQGLSAMHIACGINVSTVPTFSGSNYMPYQEKQ